MALVLAEVQGSAQGRKPRGRFIPGRPSGPLPTLSDGQQLLRNTVRKTSRSSCQPQGGPGRASRALSPEKTSLKVRPGLEHRACHSQGETPEGVTDGQEGAVPGCSGQQAVPGLSCCLQQAKPRTPPLR